MATIISHKKTGQRYVLLGTGFGAFQSKKPNWFFGDLMSDTEEGQYAMLCVCTPNGEIGWIQSADAEVVSVDGQSLAQAFQ